MTQNSSMTAPQPIFIVGSPRSGTSVLTWSLGQHPNILPIEETTWIGKLAVDLSVSYSIGTARGIRSQLSASGVQCEEFFARFGQTVNTLILDHRDRQEELRDTLNAEFPHPDNDLYQISRSAGDPKRRWVDGTPEYSFYIYGLRLLFPYAKFIHLLRDVTSVVRSFLGFANMSGVQAVDSEQSAYSYWFRAVSACHDAERAFGSGVILRIRHADIVAQPEKTLRRCLDFLGEPYDDTCLDPLRARINSSGVSSTRLVHEPGTDQQLIRQAEQLSETLLAEEAPDYRPDEQYQRQLADRFASYVREVGRLETEVGRLRRELALVQRPH